MQETRIRSLGQEDPLEKGMVTSPSILAWEIPWTEEPSNMGRKEEHLITLNSYIKNDHNSMVEDTKRV